MIPIRACERVIPVGTKVLLSTKSVELSSLISGPSAIRSREDKSIGRRLRKCMYDRSGEPASVRRERPREEDEEENGEDVSRTSTYISAWVDICRNFSPQEGMAYVTVRVVHRHSMNAVDTRGIYVKPGDLVMPTESYPGPSATILDHVML